MPEHTEKVDNVRASRDGHEFHEAWTARKAMQLLLPNSELAGIALEGPEQAAQSIASAETVEIADTTVYYGARATFQSAKSVEIVQFKYSVSRATKEFRASDAKKIVAKFAAAYRDHKKNYGKRAVEKKLWFELITNRPIYPALRQAIFGIAEGKCLTGEAKEQARQFVKASGLNGEALREFAGKCAMTGSSGSLSSAKSDLTGSIIDCSATPYALATSRIGAIRQLVRDKAGSAGTNGNVIERVDLLEALDISGVDELLPCPDSLPEIGKVVPRNQLPEAEALVLGIDRPLVVHGDGGIGKTVFLDSLAAALSDKHEIVFFDCFGGGSYRSAEDARHLPGRGLVHIANTLACRGLCDPLLPRSDNMESLFQAFRRRLVQCIAALSKASPDHLLVLLIDAIDNAAEHAKERHQPCFPTLLLESLEQTPIAGLRLIVSCRSHRQAISVGEVACDKFHLEPFTFAESESYTKARIPDVSQSEVQVAHARSQGNARILEHLATSGQGLLDPSEIDEPIILDDRIRDRIENSLSEARHRGLKRADIDAFLAGLSVLPPPVPVDEYAGAFHLDVSAINSFAADLAPLLEQTNHGLMFRDEPTETLVREEYGSDSAVLQRVAENLLARQDQSVYAARALPGLLQKLNDGAKLISLAFDDRVPAAITSTVGRHRIRYARLQAAAQYAAEVNDTNNLVQLLVELSTITAGDQRGADYILDNPDLAVVAKDNDALRRLFETRTKWPGARHARLAVANVLSGDIDDAYRHKKGADEWIYQNLKQSARERDSKRRGPKPLDHASVPVFLISERQSNRAIRYMGIWYDWYSFELCERVFSLIRLAETSSGASPDLDGFLKALTKQIGCMAGAISFLEISETNRRNLITKLANACARARNLRRPNRLSHRGGSYALQDGLRKAAAVAASLGLGEEALKISLRAPHDRPHLRSFQDQVSYENVLPFLFRLALNSAVKRIALHERDLLPVELVDFSKGLSRSIPGDDFGKKLKGRLEKKMQKRRAGEAGKIGPIDAELKSGADHFIDGYLGSLLELTEAFAELLGAPQREGDRPFRKLVKAWVKARTSREDYFTREFNRFFELLGSDMATFALWVRSDLDVASVRVFLRRRHEQPIDSWTLNRIVAILALRKPLHVLAGEQSVISKSIIDQEDDVSTRTSLYAELARAILPAREEDAAACFKAGLEQMDAIGSGDYNFTNELLLFASSMTRGKLAEKDFHTLTNICELNMSYDAQEFPWASFGAGLSKVAGWRALPKLCRWHDRSKIALEFTLLPYLTALLRDGKIDPEDALALNCTASPEELWSCNTVSLANALHEKRFPNDKALVAALIRQYEANNSGIAIESTVKALASIASEVLAEGHATTRYLDAAHKRFGIVTGELNNQWNYQPPADKGHGHGPVRERPNNESKLRRLTDRTDPVNDESVTGAVSELNELAFNRELEVLFFDRLRSKVDFAQQSTYVRIVAGLENLDTHAKFRELDSCKDAWTGSSMALAATYRQIAIPILRIHAEEFLSFQNLSTYQLEKLSGLTGVAISELSLELVKLFTGRNLAAPAAAWLGLASVFCGQADEGKGEKALARLLNSPAAQLTSSVTDGPWISGLYPSGRFDATASGMLWLMLGSPSAADRWRAAQAVRCFAKFGRWKIIDALVARFPSRDAKGFQAPELAFYYLHARLWLLIALARIALDHPQKIAKYKSILLEVALHDRPRHVVMAHFAAKALLSCLDAGALELSKKRADSLRIVDQSPLPRLKKELKYGGYQNSFYGERPSGAPEPEHKFYLDYDFEKYDVRSLSDVFGQRGWEVKDMIGEEVGAIDDNVTSMYENGGRDIPNSRRMAGLDNKHHGYGHYLGWHALMFVAGRLLGKYPVTNDWHYDEPWTEWLHRRCLTRSDGLWLSDGMDRQPLGTVVNVLECGNDGLVLTGNEKLLKELAGIGESEISTEIVVEGRWKTPDNVDVYVRSALALPEKAKYLAKKLIDEDPYFVWLPTYDGYGDDDEEVHRWSEKRGYDPWIVNPEAEGKLDAGDPLGAIDVERRPRFVRNVITDYSLRSNDPFSRVWRTANGETAAASEVWVHENHDGKRFSGVRFKCSPDFLSRVLSDRKCELLLLIKLQRLESHVRRTGDSRFSNTVAIVRVKRDLKYEYFPGAVNVTA